MRGRLLCVFLAVFAAANSASASDLPEAPRIYPALSSPVSEPTTTDRYFESFGTGMMTFGRNVFQDLNVQMRLPFHAMREHPWQFGMGALSIAALVATDQYTYTMMTDWVDESGRGRAQKLSNFGRGPTGVYLVAGVGVLGLVSGSEREQETSVMLIESLLTSALWTHSLKSLTGRERPRETESGVPEWEGPHLAGDRDEPYNSLRSFPSGHTTGAFATAAIFAHQYPTHGVVPVLAYSGAAAIAYSRLVVGAHWLSDVVVGGLIGYGCAQVVIDNHDRRAAEPQPQLEWGVNVTPDYQGVSLQYNF